jgi:hypothetical protein
MTETRKNVGQRDALKRMYNALLAIGAIDDSLHSQMWCFARAQQIANDCTREMHVNHTALMQQALGIGRRKR